MSTGTEHAERQQLPVAARYGMAPTGDPAPPYVPTGSHTHARDAFGNAVLPAPLQAGHPGSGTGNMATPGGHPPESVSEVSSLQGTPAVKRPEVFETYTGGKDSDGDLRRHTSAEKQHEMEMAFVLTQLQSLTEALDKMKEENKTLTDLIRDLTDDDLIRNLTDKAKGEAKNCDAKEPYKNNPKAGDDEIDLRDIDRKDVDKPNKYSGDTNQWRHWFLKFIGFLARRDERWKKLIEAIKNDSKDPMTDEKEQEIFKKISVTSGALIRKFKTQLYEYLETYTEGMPKAMIVTGGENNVIEVFRQLCDEGFSIRDRHLRKEYKRVIHPKQVSFENLKKAMMTWEAELAQYQLAAHYEMSDRDKIMCLEDMCPDILQQHLDSKDNLNTFAEYKVAINDYLVSRQRWVSGAKPKVNWLGLPEREPDDDEGIEGEDGDGTEVNHFLNSITGDIMALVKGKMRKGKGKGKGPKGQGRNYAAEKGDKDVIMEDATHATRQDDRKCFECGEPFSKCQHLAKDCPVRKARVAAGGPARLDKGKGKGKGGSPFPSKQQWSQFYPGPSQTQWRNWYPTQPDGKVNLFQHPYQLSSVNQNPTEAIMQNLFNHGTAYSIMPKEEQQGFTKVQKGPKPIKVIEKAHTEIENKFSALGDPVKFNPTLEVNLTDAVKPISRNRQRKLDKASKTGTATARKVVSVDPLASLPMTGRPGYHRATSADASSGVRGGMGLPADEAQPAETPKNPILEFVRTTFQDLKNAAKKENSTRPSARIFNEVCRQGSLRPLAPAKTLDTKNGKFEVLSAIVDSGATIPVMSPETGEAYDLQESEASKLGVEYEVASGDTLPNLGEKKMAVMTAEGTLRGYTSQCADVSKPLQAVRALLESKHAVCFGLGDGDDHLVINKVSGEINRLRDDGINYLQDLLIVPPDKIEQVVKELNALRENHEHPEPASDFGRQGR